jgi:hypothetical protein
MQQPLTNDSRQLLGCVFALLLCPVAFSAFETAVRLRASSPASTSPKL